MLARKTGADARFWLILVAIAVAAALFRLAVADYSLWFDEQASMFFSQQPLPRLWSSWMLREPNPPLYYSLLKGWIIAFGDTERAVRALSIAAGAGGIITTALLAGQIYGRSAGIIAAGLTAVSTQQLYFSLQARPYEILYVAASCVLISLVAVERALRLGRAWTGSLLGYALGCTACIYLHTTMFLLPVICSIALVVVRRHDLIRKPSLLLGLLAADLGIAIAAGWWADVTLRQMLAGAENIAVFDAVKPSFVFNKTIGVISFAKQPGMARTAIAVITTLFLLYQVQRSWSNPATKLLLTVFSFAIALFALLSLKVPIFLPRTIFWLSVISTALCAGGLARIRWLPVRWLVLSVLGLLVLLNTATFLQSRQTEDWNGAIARTESISGSRLIVQGEAMGLLLHTACNRLNGGTCPVPIIVVTTPDDRLDGWADGLYSGPIVPLNQITTLLKGRYFVFRKQFYHDLLKTLHHDGRAGSIHEDPPLLGPVDGKALIG